jgi:predicted XRE-type DNA-binding protein
MSLREEFKDREYRQAYADSFANTLIATQIRLLRGSMTQAQFADLVGMKQSRISAMEDENYSSWSTNTLKQIAARKDVVFLGRFVSFGELLNSSRAMSEVVLTVPPFAEDPAFAANEGIPGSSQSTTTSDAFKGTSKATTGTVQVQTAGIPARPLSQPKLPLIMLVPAEKVAA